MPGRVHEAAPGPDRAQVEVGGQDLLFLAGRPGQDAAVRADDHRVAFLQPGAVFLQVGGRHQLIAMREGGRDLVGVQHRVDTDHEHPVLAGQVLQRGDPPVADGQRGGDPQVHPLRIHVEPGQRHVVLPADQPADPAERRVHHAQRGPVAHAPHRPLGPGRDQLAVPAGERAVGRDVQHGVVDRPAVLLTLLHPDDQPGPVLTGDSAELLGGRPGHHDGVLGQQLEPVVVAIPDRPRVDPDRRAGHEDLGEGHQLRALGGRLGRQGADPVQGRGLVHENVAGLHGRHSKRCHLAGLLGWMLPPVPPGLSRTVPWLA